MDYDRMGSELVILERCTEFGFTIRRSSCYASARAPPACREYLAQLRTLKLLFPIVVLSYDFYLDPPTVVRPGLMLAVRLDEDVFRALRKGHIAPLGEVDGGRKAA
jgi:hypothetical protein